MALTSLGFLEVPATYCFSSNAKDTAALGTLLKKKAWCSNCTPSFSDCQHVGDGQTFLGTAFLRKWGVRLLEHVQ